MNEAGRPDWPWIIALIGLTAGVVAAYGWIYWFWLRTYRTQDPRDRNHKMFELANIFFWCAVCGYVFSILAFTWPAYRLLVLALVLLNVWSWKFVLTDLADFKSSLTAKATERRLHEELRDRNATLERLVQQRTAELNDATQQAVDANLAKSRFLATMSHEIRTPLTSIVGYTQILQDARREGGQAEIDGALDTITNNAAHLLTLIDDILDVSKIEAGRMRVEALDLNPLRLAHDAVGLLNERARAKGLTLSIRQDSPIPATIRSDPTRLRQILMNLIANAIKFTHAGSVTLYLQYDQARDSMVWSVRDTGIGMTDEQVRRIRQFEAFTQADETTTREYGGTGLGLRICSALASLLGGSIQIESDQGQGTTVTVRVPADRAADTPLLNADAATARASQHLLDSPLGSDGPASPHPASLLAGRRVLVADDGPDNLRLFAHYLERAGAKVETATNGRELLDTFERLTSSGRRIDLVLMDVEMPRMDGLAATRSLRANGHTIPVLALTANVGDEVRRTCLEAGCNEYACKPIDRDALAALCVRLIERSGSHESAPR
ncbi:MAG: ATP-binding protein [Phycisphaerales bacterium JB060]